MYVNILGTCACIHAMYIYAYACKQNARMLYLKGVQKIDEHKIYVYGVATISKLKIICLFCRIFFLL